MFLELPYLLGSIKYIDTLVGNIPYYLSVIENKHHLDDYRWKSFPEMKTRVSTKVYQEAATKCRP